MKMFCVTHLPIAELERTCSIPIFVGQGNCPSGWLRDDTGDNIHDKNGTFLRTNRTVLGMEKSVQYNVAG